MRYENYARAFAAAVLLAITAMSNAASPTHEQHSEHMGHAVKPDYSGSPVTDKLTPLSSLPESGAAREAGFDGRYAMEATGDADSLAEQCAKASRGLVMLDNTMWQRCGGKPEGGAKRLDTASPRSEAHSGHADH